MTEFMIMIIVLVVIVAALIALIISLNEREMDEQFPLSRKRERARMMREEWRR